MLTLKYHAPGSFLDELYHPKLCGDFGWKSRKLYDAMKDNREFIFAPHGDSGELTFLYNCSGLTNDESHPSGSLLR